MLVAFGALLAVGGGFWLRREALPQERDYHAVRAEFDRIERKIRDHDMGLWLMIEREPHEGGAASLGQEERHKRILDDFDKLGHLQSFVMSDVRIEIDGDLAHLGYALQGSPRPWRPLPTGGRMEFVRKQGRWVLDDHHFTGLPPAPEPRKHSW